MINLISGEELAACLRYNGVTSAFRKLCQEIGIRPVPGRKDCYDPVAVRHQLDLVQGLAGFDAADEDMLATSMGRRNA